jgi:hypothetical protein
MRRLHSLLVVTLLTAGIVVGVAPVAFAKGGNNPPPPSSPPTLSSVTFNPSSVVGGGSSTGTIKFNSVTDGAVVSLTSSNPAVASVPSEMVVNGGQSSGVFPVTTSSVPATTPVTITATAFGVSRTGTITVTPGAAPAADTVKITLAQWQAGTLRIQATTTNPNAILSVYSVSDSFMFDLDNNGGGRYSASQPFVSAPTQVTVKSNFGGSATKAVTKK